MNLQEALIHAQNQHHILTFGATLEQHAHSNRFRIQLPFFKPHHILAAAQALAQAAEHITEITIANNENALHFTYPSAHTTYLEQIGHCDPLPPPRPSKTTIFDRLTPKSTNQNMFPKDNAKNIINNKKSDQNDALLARKALFKLLQTIATELPNMKKLQVLAFYDVHPPKIFEKLLEGVKINARRFGALQMLVFNNLGSADLAARAFESVFGQFQLKIFALQDSNLDSLTAGKLLSSLLTLHQNQREKLLWERSLRTDKNAQKEPEFIARRALGGLVYVDLSANGFKNEFLSEIRCLADDLYLQNLDLQGNDFRYDSKFFPKLTEFQNFYSENFDFEGMENGIGIHIPIQIALNKYIFEMYQNLTYLNDAQKLVLECIAPDYFQPQGATVAQFLVNFAENVKDLEFLQSGEPHPLIFILMRNFTLKNVFYDEKIDFILRVFVEWKIKINLKIQQQILESGNLIMSKIDEKKQLKSRKIEAQNVAGMERKMSKSENFHAYKNRYCGTPAPGRKRAKTPMNYEDSFKIPATKSAQKRPKSSSKPLEIQSKQRLLKSKITLQKDQIYVQMDKISSQIKAQKKQISTLQDNLVSSKSLVNSFESQLFTPQIKIQVQNSPNLSRIEELSFETNSSEKLFNRVLDGAYKGLMLRYDGHKQLALRCFEENQDAILRECERILERVVSGKIDENEVEAYVETRINEII
ncbi:hypothetical protein SS50377_27152 [Spironucleus salmonicida]|uniref:Uncharacterized protein n=1 Tax=Spironucleus salmonicida TaxID=348837 RepID=V6LJG1_9EUKA|nr:hypothetical protein SS50377_27152 [Spironucleus salmonicida]|eukprot:EST43851.1 hypothetical protein SS50377_16395 [Spironucleus salmonicida]